jgi:predicted dehydrogenase
VSTPRALRVGLLSTASVNREVLSAASATDRVEVLAVGSRDAARAEAYAHEHGIPRAHGTYEALLDDHELDAIYVSLPNGMHHEWTMKALAAGKHVLCEKPYTRRPEEVDEAFELAKGARRVLTEGFMYRHHPQTAKVKALVDDGAVGQVQLVRSSFSFLLQDLADVRARPELDGGSLMDVGCYCVSLSRLLIGEPERVIGEQILGSTGVDMSFNGTMRFPGDLIAQFDCSFTQPRRQRLDVVGDKGWLLVDAPFRTEMEGELLLSHGEHLTRVEVPSADAFRLELENFADAAAGTVLPLLGREDVLGQARAIEALYRSATEGRVIEL